MTLGPYSRSCRTASIRSGIAGGLAGELNQRIWKPRLFLLLAYLHCFLRSLCRTPCLVTRIDAHWFWKKPTQLVARHI